ncbi:MAG: respiratory nitrate reductase subunit gamma [Candidatus Krumholzibacteria bacterium]|jgi:nitrate reductase gamma subunit|nr:respiratory nitrate reductase subunit gamma [Candidatus Krumholzibacteria bacterium]MDP7021122.1 respiratory nitrate reductase subunit gamma [Candidatus Krumholzibacteria bacterium]
MISLFALAFFQYLDYLFLAILPYVALVLFFLVSVSRYRGHPFSYSSLSSQFLENRKHFWGLVPFHYGIIVVLLGHLLAFMIPRSILAWNAVPLRLYVLEVTGLSCGFLALFGFTWSLYRRVSSSRIKVVTSPGDWIMNLLLLFQLASGVYIAVLHSWGSSWFAAAVSPYLQSIFLLRPEIALVSAMPLMVKLHIISAFLIILVFPFTRLVHALVAPLVYLARRNQVVRWYRDSSLKDN